MGAGIGLIRQAAFGRFAGVNGDKAALKDSSAKEECGFPGSLFVHGSGNKCGIPKYL